MHLAHNKGILTIFTFGIVEIQIWTYIYLLVNVHTGKWNIPVLFWNVKKKDPLLLTVIDEIIYETINQFQGRIFLRLSFQQPSSVFRVSFQSAHKKTHYNVYSWK